jgi:glycogen debranching enzyme
VPYPLACAPQAWSAGAVLLLLKAALGLRIDAVQRRVTFAKPSLPEWLDTLSLADLPICDTTIDLAIMRHRGRPSLSVLRNDAAIDIMFK